MTTKYHPTCNIQQNQLLAALPQTEADRWQSHMELVDLSWRN
jgi:hypothetical protein